MNSSQNRRRFPRLNVGPEYVVNFRYQARSFRRTSLVDFGPGGCCVQVPHADGQVLERDNMVEQIVLHGPDLPMRQLEGRVAWVMGKRSADPDGRVVVGIEFMGVPEETLGLLLEFVSKRLQADLLEPDELTESGADGR